MSLNIQAANAHAMRAWRWLRTHFEEDWPKLLAEAGQLRAAVDRVRALCDQADADPGDTNGGQWEDPTPIPAWTTAVRRALDGGES